MNRKYKILHLEDVLTDAELAARELRKGKINFEHYVVDNEKDYLHALDYFAPDIILCDHSLPSFNSLDALKILKARKLSIPFILITATMTDDVAMSVVSEGANDYILKDHLQRLPHAVINAIEKYGLIKEQETFVAELVKNEKRYRALVENGADAVVILDAEGKLTYTSPNVEKVLGYTEEEIMQMDLLTIAHPDDVLPLENIFKQVLANPGVAWKGHTGRMLHKNGSWRWLEATVTNLLHDPAIGGIVDNFRDITERKLAEEEINNKEHKFRTLIENSVEGMAILSIEGKPLYVSPSIKNVLGYTEEEGMQLDLLKLAHPDDALSLIALMGQAMANPGVPVKGESTRMLHKNGGWRWIEGTITNMLHDPSINGIVDNFRDVTERKLAEQLIKDSEEKYRSFFENSMDGILLTVTDGDIFAANPAACEMFQMTEEEICAAGRFGLADITDPPAVLGIKERLSGKAKVNVTLVRKDGSKFPGEITSVVFQDAYGSQRTSMIIRDISERKIAEEKIVQLNRLYAFASQINQTIVHSRDEKTVFKEACRIAVETGKLKAAWIGIMDMDNEKLNFVEGSGIHPEALSKFTSVSYSDNGPISHVLRTGTYYVCNNIQNDLISHHWKSSAAEWGYGSCIVLPLKKSGSIIGTFNLYASEVNFFTNEEILLLEEATGDISFALDIFEKEKLKLQADNLVKHNELRLNQAQAIAHVGSWEVDFSTGIAVWSNELLRIYGLEAGDNQQNHDTWVRFIHPDDVDDVLQKTNETKTTFGNSAYFHRIVRRDGTVRNLQAQTRFEFNNEGKPVGLYGAALDVTEMKEAEEALRNSESNLQAIFNNTSEGFVLADANGYLKSFNNKAKDDILLNSGEEISIGKSIVDFVDESRREYYKVLISKVLSGATISYDHSFKRKNGDLKWFHFNLNPVYNAGKVEGVCITAADITVRKKVEEENRFNANLLNTIGQAAVATDINGIISYWNKAAEQIYGWTKEEAFGKNIIDLTPSHSTKDQANQIIEALKQGRTWSGEFRVQRKNGTEFPALVTDSPIFDEHLDLTGIIRISSDITEKKKLEDLLDKASGMARIGSYEADLIENTLYWSSITKEIHEVEDDFAPEIETAIAFYKKGASRKAMIKAYYKSTKKNIPFDLELQIVTAKGNERWVRVIGEAEWQNCVCTKMYGSFQDIDKIKKAEFEVLKASEEKNTILESIGDAFFAVDKNWVVTYWNNHAEKILFGPKDEILGKNLWAVFSDSLDSVSYKNYQQAISTNQVVHFEDYYMPLGKWFQVSAYPSSNGLTVYFKDVTEQKQAQAALTQSEFRYRQIVETAQEGIWMIDENNITTFVNKRMCEMLDYPAEELIGKTIQTFLNEEERKNSNEQIERRKKGISENHDLKFITRSGKELWTNLSTNPILDNEGNYRGALAMITDITNRKEHEIQIQKNTEERELLIRELTISLKDLKQFSYITSHNFRAPLSNLIGLLNLIDSSKLDENNTEIIEMFKTSTNQLNKTINDLIQILVIRNNVNVNVTNINIRASLNEVCSLLSQEINENNCTINLNLKIENFSFNHSYFDSILINLLSNAIKYRSAKRPLQINISSNFNANGELLLSIQDNGLGIDLDRHRGNMFGLYQRFHSNSDSTGLGLFMVKSQITALGGSIDVESEVDRGTTFFITFRQNKPR